MKPPARDARDRHADIRAAGRAFLRRPRRRTSRARSSRAATARSSRRAHRSGDVAAARRSRRRVRRVPVRRTRRLSWRARASRPTWHGWTPSSPSASHPGLTLTAEACHRHCAAASRSLARRRARRNGGRRRAADAACPRIAPPVDRLRRDRRGRSVEPETLALDAPGQPVRLLRHFAAGRPPRAGSLPVGLQLLARGGDDANCSRSRHPSSGSAQPAGWPRGRRRRDDVARRQARAARSDRRRTRRAGAGVRDAGVARDRRTHRAHGRVRARARRSADAAVPQRMECDARRARTRSRTARRVAVPRVDRVGAHAAPLAHPQPRRDIEAGYRGIPEPRDACAARRARNDRLGARARRRVRRRGAPARLRRRLLRPAAAAAARGGAARRRRVRHAARRSRARGTARHRRRLRRHRAADVAARLRRANDAARARRCRARGDADDPDLHLVRRDGAAVLAPEIAREFGVESRWIGVFVGIVYAGAMFASLASGGFIERYGSIRVSQACVVAVRARRRARWRRRRRTRPSLLALAAVVIGLGYGPITPASSQLLQRTAPPSRMALTFSIKQTGVPAGAALAGALLPALALAVGWRAAFAIVALAGVARHRCIAQPIRAGLDADRSRDGRVSVASIFAPLALLRAVARAARARARLVRLLGDAGVPDELSRRAPDRIAALVARRRRPRADGGDARRRRRAHRLGLRRGSVAGAARSCSR